MATTSAKRVLLDTNVLLAATLPGRPHFATANKILETGTGAGTDLFTSGQILREYLAAATRPATTNGLGLEPAQALENVEAFCDRLAILDEDGRVAIRLQELVAKLGVRGKQVHDANLVATATIHGVEAILTANVADFQRFADQVEILDLGSLTSLD